MNPEVPPNGPVAEEERTVWSGHPSNLLQLPLYAVCFVLFAGLVGAAIFYRSQLSQPAFIGLIFAATIPVDVAVFKWLQNRCRKYEITTQRLRVSQGVVARVSDDVELYRVIDYSIIEPVSLRLCGLGNVVIKTSDEGTPVVVLEAIRNPQAVRDQLRQHVEQCRDRKRVRLTEIE